MKSKLLAAMVGMALLGSQASASTLVGTTSAATGIDGLLVDGVTYNVTFVHDSYNNVYSSTPPTFLGEPSTADDAANALADALTALAVTEVSAAGADGAVFIPDYDAAGSNIGPYAGYAGGSSWYGVAGYTAVDTSVSSSGDYSTWSNAATPLPAALPLFATGLGALGLLGWRRKRKAAAALAAA